MRTLITGGTVVSATDTFVADVLVDEGKIAGLAAAGLLRDRKSVV